MTSTEVTRTSTTTDSSDNSVQETTVTDFSTHDYSDHFAVSDTSLLSDNDTALQSDPSFASGNHLLGLGFLTGRQAVRPGTGIPPRVPPERQAARRASGIPPRVPAAFVSCAYR